MNTNLTLYLGIILFILALVFFMNARRRRDRLGLPSGRIIYSDPGVLGKLEKPLYDADLGLTGKPDYIVERRGKLIPVEVKSGWAPEKPYDSHIMQLASYCLLLERSLDKRPPYGLLKYKNRTFSIRYTEELEERIIDLVAEIRAQKEGGELDRSHPFPNRCERCGYRFICNQRL